MTIMTIMLIWIQSCRSNPHKLSTFQVLNFQHGRVSSSKFCHILRCDPLASKFFQSFPNSFCRGSVLPPSSYNGFFTCRKNVLKFKCIDNSAFHFNLGFFQSSKTKRSCHSPDELNGTETMWKQKWQFQACDKLPQIHWFWKLWQLHPPISLCEPGGSWGVDQLWFHISSVFCFSDRNNTTRIGITKPTNPKKMEMISHIMYKCYQLRSEKMKENISKTQFPLGIRLTVVSPSSQYHLHTP